MTFEGLYDIRAVLPDDISFIMATFLKGLYYGDSYFRQVPKDIFMTAYKQVAMAAWVSPNIRIRIACLKEDPNVILGYSVCSNDDKAVVWVFVKSAWRKQGIGRSLIPKNPLYATHLTDVAKSIMRDKFPTMAFNPFY